MLTRGDLLVLEKEEVIGQGVREVGINSSGMKHAIETADSMRRR